LRERPGDPEHLEKFKNLLGEAYVLADEENLQHYGHDETEELLYLPEVVLKAANSRRDLGHFQDL
jgi:hypothetical protein